MTVHAPGDSVYSWDVRTHIVTELAKLLGNRVARAVGDTQDGRAGRDHRGKKLDQICGVRSRGVLSRNLDVTQVLPRISNSFDYSVERLLAAHGRFLQEAVGRWDEDVDPGLLGIFHSLQHAPHVFEVDAREAKDDRACHRLREPAHRLNLRWAAIANLDGIDIEPFELPQEAE